MLFTIALVSVLAVVTEQTPSVPCGSPAVQPHSKRIVGGSVATPGSWPYAALLTDSFGYLQGVATILNKYFLVTSAQHFHSTFFTLFGLSLNHWRVYAGEYNISVRDPFEKYYHIRKVLIHPHFNTSTLENDIALILLRNDSVENGIIFNEHTRPTCLPDSTHMYTNGQMCYLPGWGRTHGTGDEEVMNQVGLPIIPDANCSAAFHGYLPNTELCAGYTNGGKDFCVDDIGSPLLCKNANGLWYMQGMASSGGSCTRADKPGVFEDMSQYTAWIKQVMQSQGHPYEY